MAETTGSSSSDYVKIIITSNLIEFEVEKRFLKSITLAALKEKLELITGGNMNTMEIDLLSDEGTFIKKISDDKMTLDGNGIKDGMKIHVKDAVDKSCDDEEGEEDVEFKLSLDDYTKREDSALRFLQKNQLGKFNIQKQQKLIQEEENEVELSKSILVGSRCQIKSTGQPTRLGEVMYNGEVHFKKGIWIGVKQDEPLGKNNGTVDGKHYFKCNDKYGSFVKPSNVIVGSGPGFDEVDYLAEDEKDEI